MSNAPQRRSDTMQSVDQGQCYELAAALYDGPRSAEELAQHLRSYLRLIGLFNVYARLETYSPRARLLESVEGALEEMMSLGWVEQTGDTYALTAQGRREAEKPLENFRRMRSVLERLSQPATVSKVSLGVHLFLAAIKLPVGLLSGSVGLMSDGVDTMLDGFASLLVFAGIKFHKERSANVVLAVMMLMTGGLAFYEAVRRFFLPVQPEVDWAAYVAVVISAVFCGLLWLYQRIVGVQSGNMALITQSVDSRNHVIVAASVTIGLVGAAFNLPLLDTIVGTVVAILILKSAVDIVMDIIRNWNEETFDVSSYKLGILDWYQRFREDQFHNWLLSQVHLGSVRSIKDLETLAHQALDFSTNRSLTELGLTEQVHPDEVVPQAIEALLTHGWLADDEVLRLSEAGRAHLQESFRGVWLKPDYDDPKAMRADMAHFLGRVAHEGRGPQRRSRRRTPPDART